MVNVIRYYDFEQYCTLQQHLEEVKSILEKHPDANWDVDVEHDYDCEYGRCRASWDEEENAQEKKERLAQEKQNEEWQRRQYESLKKKFG